MIKNTIDKLPFVSAIILAAGRSKRVGQPKQLLPFKETTIIENTIENVLYSRVGEVIVVLGYKAKQIASLVASRSVILVINHDFDGGMSTSITTGLNIMNTKAEGIMLVMGDQPFVSCRYTCRSR